MMYTFTDTTEPTVISSRPTEALKFNGAYLEDIVPGYRTLTVSGRETISVKITNLQSDTRDGARYQRKRYEPRTIIVTYQLLAPDSISFRAAYNKLLALLSVEEAQLIFADEPDKYYTGTKVRIGDIDAGTNNVVGEIEFLCSDPFKYSVDEKSVTVKDGLATVEYAGTYKSYPILEAKLNADVGFISYYLMSGATATILLGSEEAYGGVVLPTTRETLIGDSLSEGLPSEWVLNNAFPVDADDYTQVGSVGVSTCPKGDGISVTNYGSGESWHGPSITRIIPADSTGHVGARSFEFSWGPYFSANTDDCGMLQIVVTGYSSDGEKKNIAGVTYFKSTKSYPTAWCEISVGGNLMYGFSYESTEDNNVTGTGYGLAEIAKRKSQLTFRVGENESFSFKDPELSETEAKEISISFARWGTEDVADMNLYHVRFISTSVEGLAPGSAVEAAGILGARKDTIIANCASGVIQRNGSERPDVGDIKNDWENFALAPGKNDIQCRYSSWAEAAPEYKIKFREVFL